MASKFGRLALSALALGAAVSVTSAASAEQVGFCKFDDQSGALANIKLNGDALIVANIVNLVGSALPNRNGSAYYTIPQTLSASTTFKTHFRFKLYPHVGAAGGQGFAFNIQNKGVTAVGGGDFSLTGLTDSVNIVFDSDGTNNRIQLRTDGNAVLQTVNMPTPAMEVNFAGALTDAWIDYDGAANQLKVYVARNSGKPTDPILTQNSIDIPTLVKAGSHGNTAFVGFSGSTKDTVNNHDITYWVFQNDGTEPTDCVTCQNNNDCLSVPSTPACNTDTGLCVECTTNANCSAPRPYCDTSQNRCVGCLLPAHCDVFPFRPVCDDSSHECVACVSDYQESPPPACQVSTKPACQKSGGLIGACTECSVDEDALCTGNNPVCIPELGSCGCKVDEDCGGAGDGKICVSNTCQNGCRPNLGGSGGTCPSGQGCLDVAPTGDNIGVCVSGCTDDDGCPQGQHCQNAGQNGFCVDCTEDDHCNGEEVCTPQGTCGECNPGDPTLCDPNGSGGVCKPNGQCGCNTDSDCGSKTSGRVCDDQFKECKQGCRGLAFGNGCPTGEFCTSQTVEIGHCDIDNDAGVTDAGADSGFDAGQDAGVVRPDASTGFDGGVDSGLPFDPFSIEGGGCGCSVIGDNNPAASLGAFGAMVAAFGALLRRRRRRESRGLD